MVNADEIVEIEVIKHPNVSLSNADSVMNDIEKNVILRLVDENKAISISPEMFVSNKNFKRFDRFVKVYIKLSKNNLISKINYNNNAKTQQRLVMLDEIDLLLDKLCTITLIGDNKSPILLSKEIELLIK